MTTTRVIIKGGEELARAFDAVSDDLDAEYEKAFTPIADRIVGRTRSMMPRITGTAASGVNSDANRITFGDVPYQPWLDFGGDAGRVSRPWVPGGRYLYPSIVQSDSELEDAAGEAVLDVAARHRFDVQR